ncbi:atgl-1 [Scenedesmus sp. PABB004]|nr:atgl-1 [Scenedesmus sp. PABB004]
MQQRGVQAPARGAVAPPSVGSLFVPTRVGGGAAPRPTVAARTASLQRQPTADGLVGLGGLVLPPSYAPAPAAKPVPVAAPSAVKPKLRLSWAGSGIYFWWQLGAVQYLAQHFALSKVPMVGASGGGLAAVLAACDVPPEAVMESALAHSRKHNVWERPLGLMGTWGGLIEAWLDELLPADAAERCSGQVGIVVTTLPRCDQVCIDAFTDKADLINVAMASAHVPLFLDWKMTRECRGVQCLDGSFPDFFANDNCDLLKCGGDAVVFDYFFDPAIVRNGRFDMLTLKEFREFKKIILLGYRYAQRLHEAGEFERFDLSDALRARA